jgi:hypothetical protein
MSWPAPAHPAGRGGGDRCGELPALTGAPIDVASRLWHAHRRKREETRHSAIGGQRSAAIVHAKTIEQILTALDSAEKRHDDLAA